MTQSLLRQVAALAGSKLRQRYEVPVASVEPGMLSKVKRDLTFVHAETKQEVQAWRVDENGILYTPRDYGLRVLGLPEKERLSPGVAMTEKCRLTATLSEHLYSQTKAIRVLTKGLRGRECADGTGPFGGGLLHLPCGFGKTVVGIAEAVALGRRTAWLVTTEDLMTQTVERLAQHTGGTARVGIVQENTCDYVGKDFVVCMLATLHKRQYPPEFYDSFGTVVVDECHHIAAPTYAAALSKFRPKHLLGLTATPKRGDGMFPLVTHLIGPTLFSVQRNEDASVICRMVEYRPQTPYPTFRVPNMNVKQNLMTNALIKDEYRNRQIVLAIMRIMFMPSNKKPRQIIIFSSRVEHLKTLMTLVQAEVVRATGKEVAMGTRFGSKKKKKKGPATDNDTAPLIFASYQKTSEGLDIPTLDTVVRATPRGNVEQNIGRIMRELSGGGGGCKDDANFKLILDFLDNYNEFYGMGMGRIRLYQKFNYEIVRDSVAWDSNEDYIDGYTFDVGVEQKKICGVKRKREEPEDESEDDESEDGESEGGDPDDASAVPASLCDALSAIAESESEGSESESDG